MSMRQKNVKGHGSYVVILAVTIIVSCTAVKEKKSDKRLEEKTSGTINRQGRSCSDAVPLPKPDDFNLAAMKGASKPLTPKPKPNERVRRHSIGGAAHHVLDDLVNLKPLKQGKLPLLNASKIPALQPNRKHNVASKLKWNNRNEVVRMYESERKVKNGMVTKAAELVINHVQTTGNDYKMFTYRFPMDQKAVDLLEDYHKIAVDYILKYGINEKLFWKDVVTKMIICHSNKKKLKLGKDTVSTITSNVLDLIRQMHEQNAREGPWRNNNYEHFFDRILKDLAMKSKWNLKKSKEVLDNGGARTPASKEDSSGYGDNTKFRKVVRRKCRSMKTIAEEPGVSPSNSLSGGNTE